MTQMWLKFVLKSDATFGRGEGVAGLVDAEIEHDSFGLPYLHGRTLKGLLVEECANLLFALNEAQSTGYDRWEQTAQILFGAPGSSLAVTANLRVGDACLPDDLRRQVMAAVQDGKLSRVDVIEMLTDIRRQTAMEATNGRLEDYSLRAMRVSMWALCFWQSRANSTRTLPSRSTSSRRGLGPASVRT